MNKYIFHLYKHSNNKTEYLDIAACSVQEVWDQIKDPTNWLINSVSITDWMKSHLPEKTYRIGRAMLLDLIL